MHWEAVVTDNNDTMYHYSGVHDTRGYIRGCYDTIFRYGFNKSNANVSRLQYRAGCGTFAAPDVLMGVRPQATNMTICSCHEHQCNGDNLMANAARRSTTTAARVFIGLLVADFSIRQH